MTSRAREGFPVCVTAGLILSLTAVAAAQRPRRLNDAQREAAVAAMRLVSAVVAGQPPGGDAWLKWSGHFFRAEGGRTYVPFRLGIDEAPGAFRSAVMYIRVTRRGDKTPDKGNWQGRLADTMGLGAGELPVGSSDQRRRVAGQPTAAEHSAVLDLLSRRRDSQYPFEDLDFVAALDRGNTPEIQRALAVAPGEYDLYVSLRDLAGNPSQPPKQAVLKYSLTVPNLNGLSISSLVLADRVQALARPLAVDAQLSRPYAIGPVDIEPAADTRLLTNEELSVVFFIYGPALDNTGKPDVRVRYRYYRQVGVTEPFLHEGEAQVFNATTLPPGFDVRAGHHLAAAHAMPLKAFRPGLYRLEVVVSDLIGNRHVTDSLRFTVDEP
jgi:hypothetical protein